MAIKLDAKADATIAQAAARAGMGAVPKDMSKSFEGIAEGYASTMKVFGEYGAQLAQTIGQIAAPLVEDSVEKLMLGQQGFYDRKGIPEGLSSDYVKDIEEAKENKPNRRNKIKPDGVSEEDWWYQTNDAGELEFDKQKFKIAKGKWRQGINEIYNAAQDLRKGIFDNIQKVAAGDINAAGTGAKRLYQYSALKEEGRGISNGDERHKGSRIVTGKNEQGEYGFNFKDAGGNLVYDVLEDGTLVTTPKNKGDKPMFLSKGDMGGLITTQDLDIDVSVGEVKNNIIKIAKAKGAGNIIQSQYDNEVAAFSRLIPTDNKFNHATNTVLFGKETYAQTLTKSNNITQEMFIAIGGGKPIKGLKDVDGDNVIGLSDLTDNINMAIMRRELLNPKNPAAREIFLNYYEQGLRGVATDAGRQYTPPAPSGSGSGFNKSNSIKLFEQGAALIPLDQYTTAVRQDDGQYITVKNSEQSDDFQGTAVPKSASDYIKFLGGTPSEQITEQQQSIGNKAEFMKIDKSNMNETDALAKITGLFDYVTEGSGDAGTNTISEADMFSNYKVRYNGVTYSVNIPADLEELYTELTKNDPFNPNK